MSSTASTSSETAQLDDPEMGATWFYSIVGIIVFVVFVLAVCVLFFGVQKGFTEERVVDELPVLSTGLRTEQTQLLGQYGTYEEDVDEKKVERIRIPIDRAMELMTQPTR
jgi:hypothetical protein